MVVRVYMGLFIDVRCVVGIPFDVGFRIVLYDCDEFFHCRLVVGIYGHVGEEVDDVAEDIAVGCFDRRNVINLVIYTLKRLGCVVFPFVVLECVELCVCLKDCLVECFAVVDVEC